MNSKLNFSLAQLEYVLAVHKYGHFAKAAEACNVTQPTLSMQIHKLEETLDVVIFDRTKKPILLTEMGSALIQQMQVVVSEAKKIESIIEMKNQNGVSGVLTVAVIPTISPYILPELLKLMKEKFPQVHLQIKELQTSTIIESLNRDEVDVGLLAIPLSDSKMIEQSLFFEPFSVLSSKSHPISKLKKVKYSSLSGEELWLLEEGHCLRNQVLDFCKLKVQKTKDRLFQFESGSIETLKRLVDVSGGYTLIPYLAKEDIGSHSTVVEFDRPIPAREVGLVHRREHYKSHLIETLKQCILDSIPEELRKMRPKDLEVLPVED